MRAKHKWNKNAILADILIRLGLKLSKNSLWEKYVFLTETTSSGCELAEKCANLVFSEEEIKSILKELDNLYGKFKTITS